MYVYRLVSYAGIILGISVQVKHQVECLDFITPMHTRVDRAGADQGREEGMGSARQNAPMHADPHSERCALFMHRQLRTMRVTSFHIPYVCTPLLQFPDQPL